MRLEGEREEEKKSAFGWVGEPPERPPKKKKSKIDARIDSICSRFPPNADKWELVREVYGYAPYDFQRVYSSFRSDYSFKSLADMNGSLRAQTVYKQEFERSMKCFPTEDFPQLRVPAKKVEYVVDAVFGEHPTQSKIAIDMAVGFWEIFCKFLRTSEKGHENVTRVHVEYWRDHAKHELAEYKTDLHKRISAILSGLEFKTLSDPLLLAFLQPEDLGESCKSLSMEIDSLQG